MSQPTPEQVQQYITIGMACEYIAVEGDGQHFYATIVASSFEGLNTLARQRAVYAVLGERMVSEIHALSMKTHTPQEWAQKAAQ